MLGRGREDRPPHVGLAFGAGGFLGGAWMAGAVWALIRETGWNPLDAEIILGTSAGSVIAALTAGSAWTSRPFQDYRAAGKAIYEDLFGDAPEPAAGRRCRPGSLSLAVSALACRRQPRLAAMRVASGLVPVGVNSTEPIKRAVRRAVGPGWPQRPRLWIVACDYCSGNRVVFGRSRVRVDVADAVAASCAIPGWYRPQGVGGNLYVDGVLHSASNLDLLAMRELDLVLAFNPLSAVPFSPTWRPWPRLLRETRLLAARQIEAETQLLRRHGVAVVVIEPTREMVELMGHDLMEPSRFAEVLDGAVATVPAQLRAPAARTAVQAMLPSQPPGPSVAESDIATLSLNPTGM